MYKGEAAVEPHCMQKHSLLWTVEDGKHSLSSEIVQPGAAGIRGVGCALCHVMVPLNSDRYIQRRKVKEIRGCKEIG